MLEFLSTKNAGIVSDIFSEPEQAISCKTKTF